MRKLLCGCILSICFFLASVSSALAASQATVTSFTLSSYAVGATNVTYTLQFQLNEAITANTAKSMNFDLNRMTAKSTWEGGDQTSNMAAATGTFSSFQYNSSGDTWVDIDFGGAGYFHKEISADNHLLIWGLGYVDNSDIHSIQTTIPASKTVKLIVTGVTNPAKAGAYAFSVESGLGPASNTFWELPSNNKDRALYVDIGTYCLRAKVNTPTGGTAIAEAQMNIHNSNWTVSSWGGRTFSDGAISYYPDDFWYTGGPSQETCPTGVITIEANPPMGVTTYAKAADKTATLPGDANTHYATPITMSAIQLQGRLHNPAVASESPYHYVTNSNVSFRPSDFSTTGFKNTMSDNTGIFKMGGLTVGTYIMEFMMPWQSGYEGISAPDQIQIEVDATGKVKTTAVGSTCPDFVTSCNLGDVNFTVATKTITGTLKDSDGTPITSGRIQAFKEMGMGQAQSVVDGSGNYSLTIGGGTWGLRPEPNWDPSNPPNWSYCGMPKFFVFQSDTSVETKTSANTDGQTDFVIKRTTLTITGDVVYPNGSPLTSQGGVEIRSKEGCGTFAQLDGNGHFSTKVAPGTYNVMVQVWNPTYSAPATQTITISSNYNVGTLTLTEKKDTITGRVWNDIDGDSVYDSGEGISGQQVNASKMSKKFDEFGGPGSGPMMGPGGGDFTGTTSGNNGAYSLKVTPGTWMVNLMSDPGMMGGYSSTQTNYIYSGSPLQVNVTSSTSGSTFPDNNFKVSAADATIKGKVVDGDGNGISGVWGFAFADAGGGGPMMGAGMGAPIQNGIFTIKVPAGTYNVGVEFPPESSGYTPASSTAVTITGGETKSINITVKPNSRKIKVNFKDTGGNAITTLSQANIFADNGSGGHMFKMLYGSDLVSGSTTLSVSDGTWSIGYFIDPTENNYMSEPMSKDNGVTVTSANGANNPAILNITLRSSDSTISGTVTGPTGTALAGVWISTDNRKASDFAVGGPMFMTGSATDSSGNYSISLPAGKYKVQAFLPPSMGYINPDGVEVTVSASNPGTVNLQFTQSDATITGSVYLSGVKKGAFISAYSANGGYSETNATSGDFTLNVTKDDTWYVRAMYESGSDFYQSTINKVIMGGATGKSQDLTLTKASFTLPEAVSATFDYANAKKISLSNGFSISIPAGAIPPTSSATGDNITLTISPTSQLSTQNKAIPIGIGYEITATDDSGSLITSNFNDNVTITIPYTTTYLEEALGTSDETLLDNGYWDTTTSTWKGITGTSIDTVNKTISFTINHFTTFSVLSNKDPNTVGGATSSSSSSSSSPGNSSSSSCADQAPLSAPNLFRIDRSQRSVKLYFAPAKDPVTYYYIAYGLKDGDERYGASFSQGHSGGVLTYTVNQLTPNRQYWFRIRAGNGCMPGPWSKWLSTKGAKKLVVTTGSATTKISKPAIEKSTLTAPTTSSPEITPVPTVKVETNPSPTVSVPTPKNSFWSFIKKLFGR